jgi:hypothetical protein
VLFAWSATARIEEQRAFCCSQHLLKRHASMLQGGDFFKTETARLERLLESGKVGATKAAEISQKLSVLTAFSPDDEEEDEFTKEQLSKAEE